MTDTLLEFFKAMAHESRLSIIGLLAQGERSVQELARALALKEPTVSHHLAILKAQGLVTARAEGTTRWHALDRGALERLAQRVLQPGAVKAPPAGVDAWESKVLQSFVDSDGRLKTIPAGRRKRPCCRMRDFAPSGAIGGRGQRSDPVSPLGLRHAAPRTDRPKCWRARTDWRLPASEGGGEA